METIKFIYNDREFKHIDCLNIQKEHLYNGLYLYTAYITGNCYDAKNQILQNSFVPLFFNMIIATYNNEHITNITEIIKEYITVNCEIFVSNISINYEFDNSITFTPLTSVNDKSYNIYVHPNDKILDLCVSDFVDLQFVSSSKLTEYAYKKLGYEKRKNKLYNINGIYCLNKNVPKQTADLKRYISVLELENYFYFEEPIDEIIELWPIRKKDQNIYNSEKLDIQWLQQSLILINSNSLPNYTISILNDLDRTLENRVKLTYNCILAYLQICVHNPILFSFIDQITVNFDFSITAKFGTYVEVSIFKRFLDFNLQNLTVFSFSDFESALNNRYAIELTDQSCICLIIQLNEIYYVVVNRSNFIVDQNLQITEEVPATYLQTIGILPTDNLRGIIDYTNILQIKLPGTLENDLIYYNDMTLKIGDNKSQISWENGEYLSAWGITKFVNKVSINQNDIKNI